MLRSRLRTALRAAGLGTVAVLLAGCAGSGEPSRTGPSTAGLTGSGTPVTDRVCSGILPADPVTALLPDGASAQVREDQSPQPHYPVLRCQVFAGDRTVTGSAYLFNMAGPDLIQLAGSTPTTSAPLGTRENPLYGMAGGSDAWLVQECRLENLDEPAPLLVRVQVTDTAGPAPDRRQELARLTVELANGVSAAAGCGYPPLTAPGTISPAPEVRPVDDAPICGMLDPAALGPQAAGDQRRRWSASATPEGPGAVQGCDVFLDGERVLSFVIAHGWLTPGTERPGERDELSHRLVPQASPAAEPVAGEVVGKVKGLCDGHDVAYQLSRHGGGDAPGTVLGQPQEEFFKAFVNGAQRWGFKCEPLPSDAEWRLR